MGVLVLLLLDPGQRFAAELRVQISLSLQP